MEDGLFIASDGELTTAFNIAVFNELSQASVEREFEFRHYTVRECVSCKSLHSLPVIVCGIDQSTCKMSCLTMQSARSCCCQAAIGAARNCYTDFKIICFVGSTVELHLFGLIGTVLHPDVQKIRVIGLFFENRLHWQFEVLKFSTNSCFRLHIYLRQLDKTMN